ncbi:hypothetical protein JG687_00018962 [Phytophthora cactorum]|uniref:Uncharacterized protein n=1 Tax=Phytophthora cactorum TaxID=29920 RepID=A0A8T1TKJ7_9STRA|nr:hypothetical protein GQ600_22786 [Phytophthora cactorum]KAG6942609.1 hypothetical protein JG687_00018962 [Phytophthora cactorum]
MASGTVVAQALLPILEHRNALVVYFDQRFSNFLTAIALSTTKMISKKMKTKQLKKTVANVAEKLVIVLAR